MTISKSETFKLQHRVKRFESNDPGTWYDLQLRCTMPTTIEDMRKLRDEMALRYGAENLRIVRIRTRKEVVE